MPLNGTGNIKMTDVKLQLPEQGFESTEEYIKERLAPVCSELSKLCEVFFTKDTPKRPRVSSDSSIAWTDVDQPLMFKHVEKITFNPYDYPKFKGESRRAIIVTVVMGEGSKCGVHRLVRNGKPVVAVGPVAHVGPLVNYEVSLPDEEGEFWIQTSGHFVVDSFTIEARYY